MQHQLALPQREGRDRARLPNESHPKHVRVVPHRTRELRHPQNHTIHPFQHHLLYNRASGRLKPSPGPTMLRRVTTICIVIAAATANSRAADPTPAAPTTARADKQPVSAEIRQLQGKVVKIHHDVDLLGTGKPSILHTHYLRIILQEAGVTVLKDRVHDEKNVQTQPDV